jgi:hypothetical protein
MSTIKIYSGSYGHNPKPGGKQYSYFGGGNYRVGQNVVAPVRHYKSGKVYNTMFTIQRTNKLADTTRRTVTDKGADMLERFTDRKPPIFLKEIQGTDVLSLPGGDKYKSALAWKIASKKRQLFEETGKQYTDAEIKDIFAKERADRIFERKRKADENRKKKARERLGKRFNKLMKRVGNALSQGNTKPNVEQPKMVAKSSAGVNSNSATNVQQREDKRNRLVNNAKVDTNTQNKSKVDTLPEKDNTNISSASGGFTKPNQARVDVPNRKKVKQNQDNVPSRETSEDTRLNEDTQVNTPTNAKSGKMVANSNDFNSVQSNNVSRDEIDIIFALDDLGIERTRIKQIVYKLRQNGNTKQFLEWLADNNPKSIKTTIDKIFNS